MGFLLPFFWVFLFGDNPSWKKTYPTVHGKFASSHRLKSAKKVGGYVSRSQEGSLNFKSWFTRIRKEGKVVRPQTHHCFWLLLSAASNYYYYCYYHYYYY